MKTVMVMACLPCRRRQLGLLRRQNASTNTEATKREKRMSRIGFIGLGNMGLPMAQNLIKAGHQVEGVDMSSVQTDKLRAAGGAVAETAKIAAARGDVVI